jgi:hypothetical protein
MPATQCAQVYATSAYASSLTNYNRVTIANDNVFSDNSAAQMTVMTLTMSGSISAGYTATSTIGIAT